MSRPIRQANQPTAPLDTETAQRQPLPVRAAGHGHTVADLIKVLQTYPPSMLVAHDMFSERCLLPFDELRVVTACYPRPDGWIQNERPDMPQTQYLVFPGN